MIILGADYADYTDFLWIDVIAQPLIRVIRVIRA